jgi:glutathione S-transferase
MLNPSGEVPVLVGEAGTVSGHYAIAEWLEEKGGATPLLPTSGLARAEVRRLSAWFDDKFHAEVGKLITYEKIDRRFMGADDGGGGPDMATVRVGLHNLELHLEYLTYLLQTRDWLGGGELSLADFTAAAHLSCLDYTGDVPWKSWPVVRDWYARIKSRPSFRPLLADHVAGMRPPPYYADLDF